MTPCWREGDSNHRSPIEATIFRDRPEARRRQTCERLRSLQWIDVDMSAGRRGPIVHAEDEVREHECRLAVRQRHEGERRVAERFCSAGEQGIELLGGTRRLIDEEEPPSVVVIARRTYLCLNHLIYGRADLEHFAITDLAGASG